MHRAGTLPSSCVRAAIERTLGDLSHGVWTLKLVASSSPLVGAFATCLGIVHAFRGCSCTGTDQMQRLVAGGLAEALIPITMGLATGIFAYLGHHYCRLQVETFELEMKCAAPQLWNLLSHAPSGPNISN
jgi:biopolymer transport protein ExbB/TolQ